MSRWVYNRKGTSVVDYMCEHGYPGLACGVIKHPKVPDMCAQISERMTEWWNNLPGQSRVRMVKIDNMRAGVVRPEREDYQPNMERLSRM